MVESPGSSPELPPLPWEPPARPRPRPRPNLTRDSIVDAALAIVEQTGADALTMRRVAERLGVAAASLYGHVANKEQLIQLLLDRIFAESEIPDPEADDWEAVCRTWMREFRHILRRHPGVAGLTMGRVPLGPHSIRRMDALLGVARRSGIPDQVAAYCGDLFGLYVGAIVQEEDMSDRVAPGIDVGDYQSAFQDWLRALPPEEFPNMVALAKELSSGSAEERFEWGLEVLLRGVATFVPAHRRHGRARGDAGTFKAPAAAPSPGPDHA